MLRADEEFCIEAIATSFGGIWSPGDNPPDAYLNTGQERIGVEISTLTQYVTDEDGSSRPRLSEDATAIRLCDELSEELKDSIPANRTAILLLSAPIISARKLKPKLAREITAQIARVASAEVVVKRTILGNSITIHLVPKGRHSGKKVVGIVQNDKSSADILSNAVAILGNRIDVKTRKCNSLRSGVPLWLALFNDYWLADIDTYRQAIQTLAIEHPFEKILLISGDRSVEVLAG